MHFTLTRKILKRKRAHLCSPYRSTPGCRGVFYPDVRLPWSSKVEALTQFRNDKAESISYLSFEVHPQPELHRWLHLSALVLPSQIGSQIVSLSPKSLTYSSFINTVLSRGHGRFCKGTQEA